MPARLRHPLAFIAHDLAAVRAVAMIALGMVVLLLAFMFCADRRAARDDIRQADDEQRAASHDARPAERLERPEAVGGAVA